MIKSSSRSAQQAQGSFAEVLGSMPALWKRLIDEHRPDATGIRCRACTMAGTGTLGAAWPCRIRDVAESARAHHLARRTGSAHRADQSSDRRQAT
jgi:hypothetical protein